MIRPVRTDAELEACVRISDAVGVTNAVLRAQKAKLGYEERPGPIVVRGPV